ncbi:ABC transporter ATP-binding protein [Streptomyces sp. NPDC058877]|uniref:ABC transporter ATP-binding protein n=1 Tax=unclassified Streptomyces TaxID=2593676 RepID=UPI0036B06768
MLVAENVGHAYRTATVLSEVEVTVAEGEKVALVGPSGSGKTTLLYCLAGLMQPSNGRISFQGKDLGALGDAQRSEVRQRSFGFVFQSAELVPELTLRENVLLPLELQKVPVRERTRRVDGLLERLGLTEQAKKRPAKVSGGQAQRAAVARAVVHRPAVVFADEPTGALDRANGAVVVDLLWELAEEQGTAVVMVTHDRDLSLRADRSIELLDGTIVPQAPENRS